METKEKITKCPYGKLKSIGKCNKAKNKKWWRNADTGFKDKKGRKIYNGDSIKVYNSDIRIVKWDRAWNLDERERYFGVTRDKMHKPLYRFGAKNMEIIKCQDAENAKK